MAAGIRPGTLSPVGVPLHRTDRPFGQRASRPGPVGVSFADPTFGERFAAAAPAGPRPVPPPRRTPEGEARPLTAGETAMARTLFAGSVDYGRVRVHNEEYLPFGLQPDDTAMTPNGEIYFNPKRFLEDFSAGTRSDQHWFMHEMVHVWQHQMGYPVRLRGAIRIGLSYTYSLDAGETLGSHNMEAQGDLLADWWAVSNRVEKRVMAQPENAERIDDFRRVLAAFLANPADPANLP